MNIIVKPIITEKMTKTTEKFPNRFGFIVDKRANKIEITTVRWEGTNVATTTDINGKFRLAKNGHLHEIVTSMMGFQNDTTCTHSAKFLVIRLREIATEMHETEVLGRKQTSLKMWAGNY